MLQIIEQTDEEKLQMYMNTCTKKKLAEMLVQANKVIDLMEKEINQNKKVYEMRCHI